MPPHSQTITALLVVLLCGVSCGAGWAQAPTSLVLERTIPLKGVSGCIDHMAVDLRHDRLFVAELGNGTVDAILLASGRSSTASRGSGNRKGSATRRTPT